MLDLGGVLHALIVLGVSTSIGSGTSGVVMVITVLAGDDSTPSIGTSTFAVSGICMGELEVVFCTESTTFCCAASMFCWVAVSCVLLCLSGVAGVSVNNFPSNIH